MKKSAFVATLLALTISSSFAQTPDIKSAKDIGALISDAQMAGRMNSEVSRIWSKIVSDSDQKSVAELVALAKTGSPVAQNLVGYLLDNGVYGVKQNSSSAVAYFNAAAEKLPLAKYNLALMYLNGRGVGANESTGIKLMEQAASTAGVEQSYVILALFYLRNQDQKKGAEWAYKAAEYGNEMGFFLVGKILFEKQSYNEAQNWLMKAASASEPLAAGMLSRVYQVGANNSDNRVMAAGWQMIADALGKRGAGPANVNISSFGLSDPERDKAVGFAQQWLATHGARRNISYTKTLAESKKAYF